MDPNIKQSIIDRLKQTNNVLVTVKSNPTVDQLAACIGLTLFLNKQGKHATAVFSGEVPPVIEFLKPEDTLEKNTNSLRDFIISLDKSKADKLRYKVEDKVVKIFITPYRTSLSSDDLEFSQGDFNVDVVVALGVHAREELDQAIMAHGRILHDATVISVNNTKPADLGALNWNDEKASSLSEMIVSLVDGLQANSLDGQMATAFLTGIVAETERFSNTKTTSQTMSISAKLMAAGANQQLVASKLQEPSSVAETSGTKQDSEEGMLAIEHSDSKSKQTELPQPFDGDEDGSTIHIDSDGNIDTGLQETAAREQSESNEKSDKPSANFDLPSIDSRPADKVHAIAPNPTVDPMSIKNNARILTHEKSVTPLPDDKPHLTDTGDKKPQDTPTPNKTLSTLEHELDSPHVSSAAPKIDDMLSQTKAVESTPKPDVHPAEAAQSLDEARQAVEQAALSNLSTPPEPVQSLNAQPLGEPLNPPTPLDGQAGNPAETPLPPVASTAPSASTPPSNGLNLPPNLVPPDKGLPPEQTGVSGSPTPPPPVPPPLPPTM